MGSLGGVPMKPITKHTRFAEILKRAEIVFRHPDDFEFDRFEIEEVGIFHNTLLEPSGVIPVVYILWGELPNGNRGKCIQFIKEEPVDDYERRNGYVPKGYHRV
jgi:hypothetical protein